MIYSMLLNDLGPLPMGSIEEINAVRKCHLSRVGVAAPVSLVHHVSGPVALSFDFISLS